jgi:hypothetical protein
MEDPSRWKVDAQDVERRIKALGIYLGIHCFSSVVVFLLQFWWYL